MRLAESRFNLIVLQSFIFIITLFSLFGTTTTSNSLKQLHIIFRHGERAPTETYVNDPYKNFTWSGGWGQLTNRGKFEMYTLGVKIRQWYPDFIPIYYFPHDISVVSSYADRCLMSAQVLLAALFPPKDDQIWNKELLWQPIPVHYLPRSQDTLIAMKAKCKKYDEEYTQVLKSQQIQSINEENAELYRYLTQHTGQTTNSISAVELLHNTLEIEQLHNLTLPSWTRNISLIHLKELAARNLETFTETDYMKKVKGGVFLKKVIESMKNPKSGPSVYLYSAHDLTIVNILKTLGYKSPLKPGFGASFIMEIDNNTEILMNYRNDIYSNPQEVNIPNCPSACLLEQFESVMASFLPSDWKQECDN